MPRAILVPVHARSSPAAVNRAPEPTVAEGGRVGQAGRGRAHGAGRALEAAIVAGGALGALARLGLDELLPTRAGAWPMASLSANLIGCALLGYLATRLLERLPPSTYRRPLLGTGLCGALGSFTTFSTWMLETHRLAEDGSTGTATLNVAVGAAAGFAAALAGWGLGSLL